MNIIIVGIGRMGRSLARHLSKQGHRVCAVDRQPGALERLGEGYLGTKVCGNGFDRDILAAAEVERADAVIACTTSDETNIVVARVARQTYRVPTVIARVYDISKAESYRRLGIQTISTTDWGVRRACELLSSPAPDSVCEMGVGEVSIMRAGITRAMVGRTVASLNSPCTIMIVALERDGRTFVPLQSLRLEEGDILFAAVQTDAIPAFRHLLGMSN